MSDEDDFIKKYAPKDTPAPTTTSSPNVSTASDEDAFIKKYAPEGGETTSAAAPSPPPSTSYSSHLARLAGSSLLQGAAGASPLPPGNDEVNWWDDPTLISAKTQALAGSRLPNEPPQGATETLGAGVLRGLGGVLADPLSLTAGPVVAPLSAAAGGAAGAAVGLVGAPTWVQVVSGLAPGLAIGGWGGALKASREATAAQETFNAAADRLSSAKGALEEAGVESPSSPITQGKAAEKEAALSAQGLLNDFTAKTNAARDATIFATNDELNARQALVDKGRQAVGLSLGDSTTIQDAGAKLQDYARSWLTDLPKKQNEAWAPTDAKIEDTTPASVDWFKAALDHAENRAGKLQPIADVMLANVPKAVKGKLEAILNPEEEPNTIEGGSALLPHAPITWGDVRGLRSVIGDAMADQSTVNKLGRQNLSAMYAGLTKDMEEVANAKEAGAEFSQSLSDSKRLFDLAEGPIAQVVGSKDPSLHLDPAPEAAANRLLSGGRLGDTQLSALASEGFPVRELAAAKLADPSYSSWWQKLSPEGRNVLVPDITSQSILDKGIDLSTQSQANAVASTKAANAKAALDIANAKERLSFGPETLGMRTSANLAALRQERLAAQRSFDSAQANLPAPASDAKLVDFIRTIRSHGIGQGLGILGEALHAGVSPELSSGIDLATGALVGHAAASLLEPLYQGAKHALTRPRGLVGPAMGALGAGVGAISGSQP